MGNSAVQIQRVSRARDMLIDGFQDAPNEAVRNYIKQLEGSLKFNLKRLFQFLRTEKTFKSLIKKLTYYYVVNLQPNCFMFLKNR